jgi:phosphatidate cytidylyltransferase
VISALIALAAFFAIWIYGGTVGLVLLGSLAIVLSAREYSRIAFARWGMPAAVAAYFGFVSALFFASSIVLPDHTLTFFSVAAGLFLSGTLWISREKVSNDGLLPALALGLFGIVYCVLFPLYSIKIAMLPDGKHWFLFLLLVVFFGDTFAYAGGRLWGKQKLMPSVSPKKTWAGAFTGLAGSVAAGVVHNQIVFPDVYWWQTALFCILCGFVAQSGDLLISLVKRVAQVKDSGSIMPGHGGLLDRLDGLFIACPFVYAFALYLQQV